MYYVCGYTEFKEPLLDLDTNRQTILK